MFKEGRVVRRVLMAGAVALAACTSTPTPTSEGVAAPQDAEATDEARLSEGRSAASTPAAVLAAYAPNPSRSSSVNYELIDEALDVIVFNGGPSTRRPAGRLEAPVGTRVAKGHRSRFRLEGNKIFFSQFDDETKAAIAEYRQSLEAIGRRVDVTTLSRNEQLAYWFNLHNLVVIDEIAKRYPTRFPNRLRIGPDDASFHEAKIIDLGQGVPLSLRDVREIVYTHWSDPRVIYGFFHGDVGGPSIRSQAYTGERVGERLDRQAREFVNSLRGVSESRGRLLVSEIYDEARPHFFPVWPADLTAHFLEHADEEVTEIVRGKTEVRFERYDDRVADLAGGEPGMDLRAGPSSPGVPLTVVRIVDEYREKLDTLRQEGKLQPRVIIIDVPTDDPDEVVD